jgi:hypothetical protein
MIHSVRFRNFKALRSVDLDLERLTLLVGPNASGKTSALEGLALLTRLASQDPREVFVGPAAIGVVASRGATGALELAFSGAFRRKNADLSISFAAIEDYPFTDAFRLDARWGDRRSTLRRELVPPDEAPPLAPSDQPLGQVVREAAFLRFDPARLAEPSYSDLLTPVIASDGSGLASVVADMAASRPDDFARLQDAVRAVIPGLLRVRLVRSKVPRAAESSDLVWGHEIVFDTVGAAEVPARAASEGMLVALGLFAVLLGPDHHDIVLVDHLERGINPRSYGELLSQINLVLATEPIQIVAVTDAPALLDNASAESVRAHCLFEDGSVRVKPLGLHPDWEALRAELRPGAFWMQVGDAWVADRQLPPPLPAELAAPPPLPEMQPQEEEPPPPPVDPAGDDAPHHWPPTMPPLPSGNGRA